MECPNCGNLSKFKVFVVSQKVYKRVLDDEGDIIKNDLDKSSVGRFETWICSECGSMVFITSSGGNEESPDGVKPVVAGTKRKSPKTNKVKRSKTSKKIEKPTKKQLKYLNDLADKLGLPEEEREGFEELSKKEISDKLTELYKECKRRGIE